MGILDQSRKAGDAKWHQVQPENLPAIQLRFSAARASSADDKGSSDDCAQPDRGEPKARIGIKMRDDVYAIPDRVTPQNHSTGCQIGQVATQTQHKRGKHT